jgi:hypothetical protein
VGGAVPGREKGLRGSVRAAGSNAAAAAAKAWLTCRRASVAAACGWPTRRPLLNPAPRPLNHCAGGPRPPPGQRGQDEEPAL